MCYNELMNIETIIAIIVAVGGLAGLVTAISTAVFKYLDYRKIQKGETLEAKLKPLFGKLDKQEEELREIRLDTTRTQLIMLMEHQPHNHDTIIKIAERYFCQLKGDWYMTSLFKDWAKAEDIQIPAQIYQATKDHE